MVTKGMFNQAKREIMQLVDDEVSRTTKLEYVKHGEYYSSDVDAVACLQAAAITWREHNPFCPVFREAVEEGTDDVKK